MRVSSNNIIEYKYYEKPTTTNTTIRMESAMCENSKLQCLSNDLVRRLLNTRVELSPRFREGVIDQYGAKLMTSGFGREQAKKILVNGIKGYVSKMRRRQAGGRKRIHNTADESRGSRMKKKLVGKSSWYRPKQKNEDDVEVMKSRPKGGRRPKKPVKETSMRTRAVLFVEQTPYGELAKRVRELLQRLEPTLGFRLKVVERTGRSLQSLFGQTNLWRGAHCGREPCITCDQG